MTSFPTLDDLWTILLKILPPFFISIIAKVAADYKKGKRRSFMSHLAITVLAGCGAIGGYWISQWLGYTEYKMTLVICAGTLFADKFFEFLFSRYFVDAIFNVIQDSTIATLEGIISKLKGKGNE